MQLIKHAPLLSVELQYNGQGARTFVNVYQDDIDEEFERKNARFPTSYSLIGSYDELILSDISVRSN